jgi:nickel superoxide dismutase
MPLLARVLEIADRLRAAEPVHAHCDLPCGVYDPAQARIEAESVKACMEKYAGSDEETFRQRAIQIKEERADLVKHHLWVLWTDYFKPNHLEAHPNLHEMFWKATKLAGDTKKTVDTKIAQELLDSIGEIDEVFWKTKQA